MSLKSYFPEQFDQIKAFLVSAAEVVRCLRIDPEMKPMLLKALAKMEESSDFPHSFVMCAETFDAPARYFDHLLGIIQQSREQNSLVLAEQHESPITSIMSDSALQPSEKFIRAASAFADSLPDQFGSLVFVLDPESIVDPATYRAAVRLLAEHTTSKWLKYLIFDSRVTPQLADIENEAPHIGMQTFYLSPDEIEKRVSEDLQSPGEMSPVEQRQYKGLLAGFASARGEYDRAAQLQRAWALEAENSNQLVESATAHYNLGNTLLAKGDLDDATTVFCKVCELCVEHKINGLAPFAYTNLGLALHQQGQLEQAIASLSVARNMFRAQNQRASEAYVVGSMAQLYAQDGHNAAAERGWRYALTLYDGMTSSLFKDLRENGRQDILEKLAQLSATTGPRSHNSIDAQVQTGST